MQITKCDSCGKVVKEDFEMVHMFKYGRKDSFRFDICDKCAGPLQAYIKKLTAKVQARKP